MENNNSNQNTARKEHIKIIICVILAILGFATIIPSLSSSNDDKSSYEENLRSGMTKYYSGEKMSREEYNAISNYMDWKDKQTDKSYNDWNSKH